MDVIPYGIRDKYLKDIYEAREADDKAREIKNSFCLF